MVYTLGLALPTDVDYSGAPYGSLPHRYTDHPVSYYAVNTYVGPKDEDGVYIKEDVGFVGEIQDAETTSGEAPRSQVSS